MEISKEINRRVYSLEGLIAEVRGISRSTSEYDVDLLILKVNRLLAYFRRLLGAVEKESYPEYLKEQQRSVILANLDVLYSLLNSLQVLKSGLKDTSYISRMICIDKFRGMV